MKRWYVVQVYAGYEAAARADLLKSIEEQGLHSLFGEVLVPSAKAQGVFGLSVEERDRQLFPGYMLVEMEPVPEAIRLVQRLPRVMRFLGGKTPVPLAVHEVDRVLAQIKGEVAVSKGRRSFEVDKEVEIVAGPFSGFVGMVESVNEEAEKLTVMVSILGRMAPVELHFDQIKS
jgi:transcriptional antiterminator NusG